MQALAAGELPPPPIAVLLRMQPVELEPGRAVFEGEPGEEHYNPIGVVHGGYAATLLDSALGCAVHTTLPAGDGLHDARPRGEDRARRSPPTTELVRAEAEVLYRGRRQATAQAKLHRAADAASCSPTATATCMIIGCSGRQVERRARDQQPDAEAAGALADVLAAGVPGGAGDVEVGPGDVVDELLEERAGVDRSRLALRRRRW